MLVRSLFFLAAMLPFSLPAQTPVYQQSFPGSTVYNTCKGVSGTALDLSGQAAKRFPLAVASPLKSAPATFTVMIWVKAADRAAMDYSILQATDSTGGWKIGMQENGAWYWQLNSGRTSYVYRPTPARQSLHKQWHQLTFSYDARRSEAALYYDGKQVAIYYTENISSIPVADSLLTGGIPAGDIGQQATFNGALDEITIWPEVLSAETIRRQYQRYFPALPAAPAPVVHSLKVMNFNIWHGGNETGRETGPQRIVDIIRSSGADIISMQETYGSGEEIADALGYYFYLRSSNLSIMSRYPIAATTPGEAGFFNGGAYIRLNNRQQIAFITNWLSYPYDYWDMLEKGQPLQADSLAAAMENANGKRLRSILRKLDPVIADAENIPVIFCGDLNSGSHLDWTAATRHLNGGLIVPFPQSLIMAEAGFKDSYRIIHPDPLKDRGITWSPQFPNAFKDRIDYIYYKGSCLKAVASTVINTHPVHYPSDHGALLTTFYINSR